jgi:hypothetical protein
LESQDCAYKQQLAQAQKCSGEGKRITLIFENKTNNIELYFLVGLNRAIFMVMTKAVFLSVIIFLFKI